MERRHAIPITPELKIRDDEGWYVQLKLHYYLTHDPALVQLRDLKEWQGHLDRGDGKVALQDVRLLTAQVETLKALGVLNLLSPERPIRATDADVEQLRHHAVQYAHDLKAVFNLTISEKMTPIEVVQALLGKLGLKLTCVGRDVAPDGRRGGTRVYQYQPPEDGRETIFAQWQQRDNATQVGLVPSVTVAIAAPDPPPDIYTSKQSAGGSNRVETAFKGNLQIKGSQTGECLTPEQASGRQREEGSHQGPRIEVGSLVKRVQQACYWVVKRLEKATARLEYPRSTEKRIVPLNELRLVGEEEIP